MLPYKTQKIGDNACQRWVTLFWLISKFRALKRVVTRSAVIHIYTALPQFWLTAVTVAGSKHSTQEQTIKVNREETEAFVYFELKYKPIDVMHIKSEHRTEIIKMH
jgi:hypothetical protein